MISTEGLLCATSSGNYSKWQHHQIKSNSLAGENGKIIITIFSSYGPTLTNTVTPTSTLYSESKLSWFSLTGLQGNEYHHFKRNRLSPLQWLNLSDVRLTCCWTRQSLFLAAGVSLQQQTVCDLRLWQHCLSLYCFFKEFEKQRSPCFFLLCVPHCTEDKELSWRCVSEAQAKRKKRKEKKCGLSKEKERPQWNKTYSICTPSLDSSQPFNRMSLLYQGDCCFMWSFILFAATVIETVPREICCGAW